MNDDLNKLVRIARSKPRACALCCPECGANIEVNGGVDAVDVRLPLYHCVADCGFFCCSLAQLKRKE